VIQAVIRLFTCRRSLDIVKSRRVEEGWTVGQLVGRNIGNAVKTRLQRSAKRHGRSMEEEVRDMCHGSFI
jgi:hypothetical protein